MYTISDIIMDINRGCAAHNMTEDRFSYRIVFYVNENDTGRKCYVDTSYSELRPALENIIRNNLTVTNNVTVAAVTVRKDGRSICLQSRSYPFSLDKYFNWINGKDKSKYENNIYGNRYAVR